MLVLIDYLRLSRVRRREARREAGLLVHEHGEDAIQVVRRKMADPARSVSRSELRLTLHHVRELLKARRKRPQSRRRRS
ncbi:hypothetical protein HZF05_18080 [Sphingomonas sp. CGMCC 1.13654]|uniref:Uncharacterized protein n=1 Tax=Sphingomonas chungangi TaxID=2683589 RepID=A0A838L979_9SPHN|nr:hypothetical protein [Sphingomonas chungangi]MBA2935993.1 hypothetical protein [Sphingomonas chungangi]MVW55383.1 hypothetical protein [Sphingomonas chungangi]